MEKFIARLTNEVIRSFFINAFLKEAATSYLWLPKEKTAVLETARICGLGTAKKEELDALGASSFGVGEVLRHTIKRGAKKIYVGLGGVACNDGGAGIARALGARFLDTRGRELPNGAKPLLHLARIETEALQQHIRGVKIYAVADVTNPLLGPKGLQEVAELNVERSHQLAELLGKVPGFKLKFAAPFFNEFVLECPVPAKKVIQKLEKKGISAGYALGADWKGFENCLLVCATETKTEADLKAYAAALEGI